MGGVGSADGSAIESSRDVEPNRNFPLPGEDYATARARGAASATTPELVFRPSAGATPRAAHDTSTSGGTSIRMLSETRALIALIERFQPERIASIQAHSLQDRATPANAAGNAPGIFVDPRGGVDASGAALAPTQAAEDERLATAMVNEGVRRLGTARTAADPGTDLFRSNMPSSSISTVRYAPSAVHPEGQLSR